MSICGAKGPWVAYRNHPRCHLPAGHGGDHEARRPGALKGYCVCFFRVVTPTIVRWTNYRWYWRYNDECPEKKERPVPCFRHKPRRHATRRLMWS